MTSLHAVRVQIAIDGNSYCTCQISACNEIAEHLNSIGFSVDYIVDTVGDGKIRMCATRDKSCGDDAPLKRHFSVAE